MKKVYFIITTLVVVMLAAGSCSNTPKNQGDSPVPETPVEEIEDIDEFADIDAEDADGEEPDFEEADLADAEEELPAEDEFPAEDELLAEEPAALPVEDEPEPPVVAAVPEPEPPPPPPPPPPVTPPPAVTARPATPPPPVAAPAPPPAVVQTPPPAEEPPAREPVPRVIPELPNPTPAFRGRPDDEVVFSRTVRATVGQLVVVPFRGTNWVYLGEVGAQRGISYDSRRLDPEGQSIIFRTEAPGEYALKFYRQDFIRDFILNDYVQVIVSDPPETAGTGWNPLIDRGRVIAEPRWPTSLEEALALRGNTQPSRPDTAAAPPPAASAPAAPRTQTPPPQTPPTQPAPTPPVQTPPAQQSPPQTPPAQQPSAPTPPAQTPPAQAPRAPTPVQPPAAQTPPAPLVQTPPAEPVPAQTPPEPIPELEPDEYLQKAKEEFEAGRVAAAIAYLDRFCQYYPVESDEVLWLYGQFYEANSPSRNVLAALDCYRRLTQEYPQSSRYDAARRRIAYLQRYYINIQ